MPPLSGRSCSSRSIRSSIQPTRSPRRRSGTGGRRRRGSATTASTRKRVSGRHGASARAGRQRDGAEAARQQRDLAPPRHHGAAGDAVETLPRHLVADLGIDPAGGADPRPAGQRQPGDPGLRAAVQRLRLGQQPPHHAGEPRIEDRRGQPGLGVQPRLPHPFHAAGTAARPAHPRRRRGRCWRIAWRRRGRRPGPAPPAGVRPSAAPSWRRPSRRPARHRR